MADIFITGGTGYIGSRLIKLLLNRGYNVIALVRKGSEHKVPRGASIITADPFDATSFQNSIPTGAVYVQLLGVPHPSPAKAKEFRSVDLRSVKASATAAAQARVSHFVYVSVAMTSSKLMKAYQDVRRKGEEYCMLKKLNCTFIRPWYVIGPGHYWPVLLLPLYGIAELVPSWRSKARSMGLVTIKHMVHTLANAVEAVPEPMRLVEIKNIRNNGLQV